MIRRFNTIGKRSTNSVCKDPVNQAGVWQSDEELSALRGPFISGSD